MDTRFASLGFAVVLVLPLPAAAQVLSRPVRAAEVVQRTTDPAHTSHTLAVSVNLLGGYDANDADSFVVVDPTAPPVLIESTSTGTIDAGLEYSNSRGTRLIGATVNGATTFYGDDSTEAGPSRSFGAGLTFATPVGDATRFSADQRVFYNSLYSLGAFDDLALEAPIGEVPIGGATQGVGELESLTSDTNLAVSQRLGRRNSVSGTYGFVRQVFTGPATGDTNSHRGTLVLSRQVQRTTAVNVSYNYSSGEYAPLIGGGGTRPLIGHFIQSGFEYTKRLSPRRALQLNASVGATRAEAVTGPSDLPYSFWAPSGSMQARIDLGRTWALSANYNHGTTALAGLTEEAYSSGAFNTSLGGSLGRLDLVVMGGAANGSTGAGAAVSSDYTTYTGAVQLGVPITQRLSALVQYTWYQYQLSGNAELPQALPPDFTRSSVRAGLTVNLPIIETR